MDPKLYLFSVSSTHLLLLDIYSLGAKGLAETYQQVLQSLPC